MLLRLLVTNKTTFMYLFLFFPTVFRNVLGISSLRRNTRLKLALAMPIDTPITMASEQQDNT